MCIMCIISFGCKSNADVVELKYVFGLDNCRYQKLCSIGVYGHRQRLCFHICNCVCICICVLYLQHCGVWPSSAAGLGGLAK